MADAKKCDRCKKFYDIYAGVPFNDHGNRYNGVELRFNNSSIYCRFELCQDCMQEVVYFLTNVPAEKKTEENVSKEMSDAAIERGKWGVFG